MTSLCICRRNCDSTKGHYGSKRALLAFRVSVCDSACSAIVSMDRGTIADIIAWKQS